ncbi:MAG: hypothetical protein HW406_682 [Candidatus Brocadiaceae bacterium]|nr:hypothetical protein [Candidatus Brocadiaceae bacterium]
MEKGKGISQSLWNPGHKRSDQVLYKIHHYYRGLLLYESILEQNQHRYASSCSHLRQPEYCEKPYHEFPYGRVSPASSAGKLQYLGDFLCRLIRQMPYREIDQSMKSFLLCNCLRNVEHICEIHAWVRNRLLVRKQFFLYFCNVMN